ncbi:MAG: hypothetical protein ACO3MX_09660, partial [Candidatus Puniceispirillaceae bacterium]
ELFASTDFSLFEGALVVEPYALQALDFGYASDRHDGLNNFQAGLALHYPLGQDAALFCSLNHSWAQKDVRNDGMGDVSWVGLGFSGRFFCPNFRLRRYWLTGIMVTPSSWWLSGWAIQTIKVSIYVGISRLRSILCRCQNQIRRYLTAVPIFAVTSAIWLPLIA